MSDFMQMLHEVFDKYANMDKKEANGKKWSEDGDADFGNTSKTKDG